jgi:hypothetical protein
MTSSPVDVVRRFVLPLVALSLFLLPKRFRVRDRRHNFDGEIQAMCQPRQTDGAIDPTLQGEL